MIFFSHTSYHTVAKIKKNEQPQDKRKVMSLSHLSDIIIICHISAYLGTSLGIFKYKMWHFKMNKKDNLLFVLGWDRKICSSGSELVITGQAS